jgi:hypothetical protein
MKRQNKRSAFNVESIRTVLKLASAFSDTANSAVTVSVWFQPEVPYPAVDFSKLKPRRGGTFSLHKKLRRILKMECPFHVSSKFYKETSLQISQLMKDDLIICSTQINTAKNIYCLFFFQKLLLQILI